MEVEGKAAVVTGGSGDVGRATAVRLARLGCSVLVHHNRSRQGAEETAAEVEACGVKAVVFGADVAQDEACRAMVEEAARAFGHLEILVNNAGITRFIGLADLEAVRDEDWEAILGVNLKGPFQCTRAARLHLEAAGGGEVVMTSSVAGLIGTGSSIPYCASKAALNNLVVTLARALAPAIRVNAVAPGFIEGEWLKQGLGPAYDAVKQAMQKRSPLSAVCQPDDVAQAIVSLIAGSDLVTGHVLPVEGGMILGT